MSSWMHVQLSVVVIYLQSYLWKIQAVPTNPYQLVCCILSHLCLELANARIESWHNMTSDLHGLMPKFRSQVVSSCVLRTPQQQKLEAVSELSKNLEHHSPKLNNQGKSSLFSVKCQTFTFYLTGLWGLKYLHIYLLTYLQVLPTIHQSLRRK